MIDGERDTQGWNRFGYVKGNPVIYKDPTGHERTKVQGFQDLSEGQWSVVKKIRDDVVNNLVEIQHELADSIKYENMEVSETLQKSAKDFLGVDLSRASNIEKTLLGGVLGNLSEKLKKMEKSDFNYFEKGKLIVDDKKRDPVAGIADRKSPIYLRVSFLKKMIQVVIRK